ncbi:MAG: hypothetical protein KA354_18065 [Phycisphaerae bacterium]|nr:hypothetical protein [Phycisphaerae bacterium]
MGRPTRNALLALTGVLVILAGGWWGYTQLTTAGPPSPGQASPEEVAGFLGNPRGLIRLPLAEREAYLRGTFQHFSSEESRSRLGRCIRRMSDEQKQALVDATFEVVRVRMLEAADRFKDLPLHQRDQFVGDLIADFHRLQGEPAAGTNPDTGIGESFKGLLPATGQDWNQLVLTRTTPEERARATPLAMAIAEHKRQEHEARRKRQQTFSRPEPSSSPADSRPAGP